MIHGFDSSQTVSRFTILTEVITVNGFGPCRTLIQNPANTARWLGVFPVILQRCGLEVAALDDLSPLLAAKLRGAEAFHRQNHETEVPAPVQRLHCSQKKMNELFLAKIL